MFALTRTGWLLHTYICILNLVFVSRACSASFFFFFVPFFLFLKIAACYSLTCLTSIIALVLQKNNYTIVNFFLLETIFSLEVNKKNMCKLKIFLTSSGPEKVVNDAKSNLQIPLLCQLVHISLHQILEWWVNSDKNFGMDLLKLAFILLTVILMLWQRTSLLLGKHLF